MPLSNESIREIIRAEAFRGESQAEQQRWRVNEATMKTIVRYCRAVETESRLQYKAELRELAATAAQHPTDPLDWPLPCDVTVGHATMHKGVTLRSLVAHMKTLYEIAARRNLIRNEQPLSFNEMTFGGCPSCGSKACVALQCRRTAQDGAVMDLRPDPAAYPAPMPEAPARIATAQADAYVAICETLESLGLGLLSRLPTPAQINETCDALRVAMAARKEREA